MENAKIICETDAEILLEYKTLKDDGYAFVYAKNIDGIYQRFVNCNGKIFGPYDYVYFTDSNTEAADWTAEKGALKLKVENNGKDCKTEKKKKEGGNEVLSQDEIDLLLSAIAEDENFTPAEEYNERTHILKLNRKKQEFFVTDKKSYGPYNTVFHSEYLDDEHFQFTYRKRAKSNRWYYNLNGKEIGPFCNTSDFFNIHYDRNNRAILDHLKDSNCIFIDGKKIKCFKADYERCRLYNFNNHEIFLGLDSNGKSHVKRDGIELNFFASSVNTLDNGDIVYSKFQDDKETWFYNDQQISVPIIGHSSSIYETIITYKRKVQKALDDIQYFQWCGKEYNGMIVTEPETGFVWLEKNYIYFLSFSIPRLFGKNSISVDKYNKIRGGYYLKLFYGKLLAGRD